MAKEGPNKVELGMTPEEVKNILGEPDDIETGSFGAIIFYYTEDKPYKEYRIKFLDSVVIDIHIYGKEED